MPHLTPLFILLLCTCGRAHMNAQPQTDPLRLVNDVTPQTNALGKRWAELMDRQEGEAAARTRDTMELIVLGEFVTPSYLVDRNGKVWNLGVLDQPFVVHTFGPECFGCDRAVKTINKAATAFANEFVTFVLMPTPEDAVAKATTGLFNDDVIVIYDDYYRDPYKYPNDPRLLGLLGYPFTYFIATNFRIIGLQQGAASKFLHPKKGKNKVIDKIEFDRDKGITKSIERLLAYPKK